MSYLFVFRWGALFFNEALTSQSAWFLRTYLVLGLLIPILCAYAQYRSDFP